MARDLALLLHTYVGLRFCLTIKAAFDEDRRIMELERRRREPQPGCVRLCQKLDAVDFDEVGLVSTSHPPHNHRQLPPPSTSPPPPPPPPMSPSLLMNP